MHYYILNVLFFLFLLVNSDVFTDYSRLSESTKSDSSNDGTGFYSNSSYGAQSRLPKENILQDRISESNFKNNSIKMKLPTPVIAAKTQPLSPHFKEPLVEKSTRSPISTNTSTQIPLKIKGILKAVNNTSEPVPLYGSAITSTQKNLAQLNNMSISRMKERHRQECRKSGQWSHTPNKAQIQTQNSMYTIGSQRQQVPQSSPMIVPPSASVKYQVYTPPISSRTKCHPLPSQSTVVPRDQNQFHYGSLRSIGPRYHNTQENIPLSHNGAINYGRRPNSQCIEHPPQYNQARDIHNFPQRHQSMYNKSECQMQRQSDDNASLRISTCINQKKKQNIIKLGEIFDKHMSNNPKLKAEIDRMPHMYNKSYHSVPHSLYLLANEKPKLAHRLMADTLIRRKGAAKANVDGCHDHHCCPKSVEVHPKHRSFYYTRTQAYHRPSVTYECYSKRGSIEAPSESSETYHERTYNEKKIRSMNVAMREGRYNQDYKNYYRH
jgi:hypothetical protein